MFSRELLERVGYLDEGYAVGNFEDDDWIIRVKLAGYQLAVAGDAFIHHFGSVSMKALGEQDFAVVNKDNEQFYSQKWEIPMRWLPKPPAWLDNKPLVPHPVNKRRVTQTQWIRVSESQRRAAKIQHYSSDTVMTSTRKVRSCPMPKERSIL